MMFVVFTVWNFVNMPKSCRDASDTVSGPSRLVQSKMIATFIANTGSMGRHETFTVSFRLVACKTERICKTNASSRY